MRMAPDLLGALDRFAAEGGRSLSRPEALRIAFREFALARGYIRPASSDEGTRPYDLTSDNDG
ncbi:hypothetical protein C3941_11180 [Kaistia algarum]|nr:hypothetical protein C3941_11180 [Kaistia algarum]